MSRSRIPFEPLAVGIGLALLLAVLALLTVDAPVAVEATSADDWRRTAAGWERTTNWPQPSRSHLRGGTFTKVSTPTSAPDHVRFDTHPAVLALAQLLGALMALAAFSAPRAKPGSTGRWHAAIARSFRASVFGS
jgi:hypothetical protein